MEELTIEQKAKRYDVAIEKAKDYYNKGKVVEFTDYVASDIFPELKESVDEKISKAMKKGLIVILVCFIVAGFFYAAVWTNEKNTLSDCWMFTGIVAIFQITLTCTSYSLTQIRD